MNKDTCPHIWKDKYSISSYEVDANSKASLQSLCNFMQESAWHHAEALRLGFSHLIKDNQIWVLSRLLIKVNTYPKWGDTIYVQTWPKGAERVFAYRDFHILDEDEDILAAASSAWIIMSLKNRRPQRMDAFSVDIPILDKHALKEKLIKLPPLSKYETQAFFTVQFSDLDINEHVNNCKYIEWILDSYTYKIIKNYEISTFEINFLSEAFYRDELSIRSERIKEHKLEFLNNILRKNDNHEICRARTEWRREV